MPGTTPQPMSAPPTLSTQAAHFASEEPSGEQPLRQVYEPRKIGTGEPGQFQIGDSKIGRGLELPPIEDEKLGNKSYPDRDP